MKTSKKSLALAVILSLGVCANAWAAQGTGAVQVDGGSTVPGSGSGAGADASGNNSVAIGSGSQAITLDSIAIGDGAVAGRTYQAPDGQMVDLVKATAIGSGAKATDKYANAIGANATASGQGSIAIGGEKDAQPNPAIASGLRSVAIGGSTTASSVWATAVGFGSKALGRYSFAVNAGEAYGNHTIAIGFEAEAGVKTDDAYGTTSIAMGQEAKAKYKGAMAIGDHAQATSENNIALGYYAKAYNANSTAIGEKAEAKAFRTIALGSGASSDAWESISVGVQSWAKLEKTTAIGTQTRVIGKESTAVGYGIEVGERYYEEDNGFIENDSHYATALGNESKVKPLVNYGTALGYKAKANHNNSVALGANSVTSAVNSISVGSVGAERRIMNVDKAAINTDALTFNNFRYAQGADQKNYITEMVIGNDTYYFKVGETITVDNQFDDQSKNPVENQLITNKINDMDTKIDNLDTRVGDTNYAISPNYVTNNTSATKAIGDLDNALKNEANEREAADKDLQEQINNLGGNLAGDVERLDSDVKSVGAMAAAMAGLHPRFTGDGKGELAAAIGSYDGKKATAIGAFYAPDERFMFSLGGAFAAGGKKMANLGVNIALDPKPHVNKKFYEQEILELKASNQAQAEKLDAQAEQIQMLMQRLAALEAKK